MDGTDPATGDRPGPATGDRPGPAPSDAADAPDARAEVRPTLIVHHSRRWALPVTSVVLALLGVLLLAAGSPTERIVGAACAAVFGLGALVTARPRKRPPALVLGPDGLTDAASPLAAGFLPWSGVTGALVQRSRGQRYLTVLVESPEAVLAAAEPSSQAAMRANLTLLGSPVNIPLRPMTVSVAELTLELARRASSTLPAAVRARSTTRARPGATPEALAELTARAAEASVALPEAYLDLLVDQDGFVAGDLRLYGTRSSDGLEGVLEANEARYPDAGSEPADLDEGRYVVLARDAVHDYCARMQGDGFRILARSDHRSLAQPSTFSDLIVAALTEFTHPFG